MAKAGKRPLAVFNIRKYRKIGDFFIKVAGITQNIKNNVAIFMSPQPPILTVEANVGQLGKAEIAVQTRAPGTVAARDQAYDQVLDDVHTLQNYVQDLADAAADEQAAVTIIQTSGFELKVNGVRVKAPLEAKNSSVSGTVKLTAKAADKRSSYNWQMSGDGGTSWADLPSTLSANTIVTSLKPGSNVQFRVRAITKDGTGSWSQSVSLIVQ